MQNLKNFFSNLILRFSIVADFLKTLWKYKLWWSFPIILTLLFVMLLLLVAGNTGVAALVYPLF